MKKSFFIDESNLYIEKHKNTFNTYTTKLLLRKLDVEWRMRYGLEIRHTKYTAEDACRQSGFDSQLLLKTFLFRMGEGTVLYTNLKSMQFQSKRVFVHSTSNSLSKYRHYKDVKKESGNSNSYNDRKIKW